MSRLHYISDVKLCLEILARFEIYPDLAQLEQFLANEAHLALMQEHAEQIKAAWEKNFAHELMTASPLKDWQSCSTPLVNLEKNVGTDLTGFKNQESLIEENPLELETVNLMQPAPQISPIHFKLPNATIGKSYQANLEWHSDKSPIISTINGLEKLGLSYELNTNTITGEPLNAGEYPITICYYFAEDSEQVSQTTELKLVINNDPKSLWKNIPSDNTQLFWKDDTDCQGQAGLYGWKMAAASIRGRSHAHVGSCRDDDFAILVNPDSLWQILAVADGAGSCQYSREGARIVAHHSVEVLNAQLQQATPVLDELINHWQQDKSLDNEMALHQELVEIFKITLSSAINAIETLAQQQQACYRDFYSTLLLAAHKSLPHAEFIVAYWIGDGGLGIYHADKSIQLLGEGDSGEYAGQTRFLDKNALALDDLSKRVNFVMPDSFSALILMTDGITDPLFETDNNLRDLNYWQRLWQQLSQHLTGTPELNAKNLMQWLDFWSPGNHDDRTIALLYR